MMFLNAGAGFSALIMNGFPPELSKAKLWGRGGQK